MFFRYLQNSSTHPIVPAQRFPRQASHLRKHLCNCSSLPVCPLCNQGCDLELPGLACVFKHLSVAEQAIVRDWSSGCGIHMHSELYLVRSGVLPRMKHMQSLWTTCSKAWWTMFILNSGLPENHNHFGVLLLGPDVLKLACTLLF